MFDTGKIRRHGTEVLRALPGMLAELDADIAEADISDAERIDQIRLLTELEAATAAARAKVVTAFAAAQRAAQVASGVPSKRVGRGVASQVALAMRTSPHRAQRYVGWCTVLMRELPETFAALQSGRTTEWRAMIVARETVFLSREDRLRVDSELAPEIEAMGDRKVEAAAKRIGYRLDPYGFVKRSSAAEKDRYVSVRPAPDAMARLTALLPVAQGVAAYAALARAADTSTASGDERGRGQVMADTLVERLTGQAQASEVPVEIQLVMTDQTLLSIGAKDEPAEILGYGPIPAGLARRLALDGTQAPVWLRRLFTAPKSGQLIAMESRRRSFVPPQRHFVSVRDGTCLSPWCDAPIRHIDHVEAAVDGGPTSVDNAQGYCQACNIAKQAQGWKNRVIDAAAGPHEVEITTPTGHRYRSRAPDPPGRAAA